MISPALSLQALAPDLEEAARFLAALGQGAQRFTFQTFDDDENRKDRELAWVAHGTLAECAPHLAALQRRGGGAFNTVNVTDGSGYRKARNIVRSRAIWVEWDGEQRDFEWPVPPSIEVESSPGKRHFYWLVNGLTKDEHTAVMATMVRLYGSDPKAADLARVLRLPGFWHLKDPNRPHLVRIVQCGIAKMFGPYSRDEIIKAFPPTEGVTARPTTVHGGEIAEGVELDGPGVREMARSIAENFPLLPEGGRNDGLYKLANKLFDIAASPATALELCGEWAADVGIETASEVETTVASAWRNREETIGGKLKAQDDAFSVVDVPPAPEVAQPPPPASLLRFPRNISLAAIVDRQDRELIADIIPGRGFGVLYGASGAGKTFVALEMAYAIARGAEWHGRHTRRACVLYISLEGEEGFHKRVKAAEAHYGPAGDWFSWLAVPVLLSRGELGATGVDTVIRAATELKAHTGATECIIFVDTLARAMAGDDENSAEAMSFLVEQRSAVVARAADAAVMVVHHTAKSTGDMRGSSVLRAASDFILRAERTGEGRKLIAEKVKDGEDGATLMDYQLKTVRLAENGAEVFDKRGRPVTTCIVHVPQYVRDTACENMVVALVGKAATIELSLSPSPHSGSNYAVKWMLANGAAAYSAEEIARALNEVTSRLGLLRIEKYENKGKPSHRYVVVEQASGGSPAVPASGGPGGSPVVQGITAGTPEARAPEPIPAVQSAGGSVNNHRSQQTRASGGSGGSSLPTGEDGRGHRKAPPHPGKAKGKKTKYPHGGNQIIGSAAVAMLPRNVSPLKRAVLAPPTTLIERNIFRG